MKAIEAYLPCEILIQNRHPTAKKKTQALIQERVGIKL